MSKLVSKHVRMGKVIADWYEQKASEIGIAHTNLMVVALMEFMKQTETIGIFGTLKNKIEEEENQLKK